MTLHLGNVPAGSTLYIPFTTYDKSNGASVTMTGLAVTDIEIYKNGSTTQRASDAGYALLDTDGIDFDGITGLHGFSIDLSDNTDAGFFAVGSFYWVVVSTITIDSQTVTFVPATFRIVAAEATAGYPMGQAAYISDDAIKAATFDESTAFPLASADTGSTAVARTGADGDTLETLSDQIDGVGGGGVADEVWSHATRTLTHPQVSLLGDPDTNNLECIIAATFEVTWSGLNIDATWTAIEFTAKKLLYEADTTALLQVLISNPGAGGDGLQRYMGLAGGAYVANAALTVDQPNGAVTLLVEDDVTALLTKQKVYYDLKLMLADGSSSILVDGTFDAVYTPTKTINL